MNTNARHGNEPEKGGSLSGAAKQAARLALGPEGAALSEQERFQKLGERLLAQLGIPLEQGQALRERIRSVILGQLQGPSGAEPEELAEMLTAIRYQTVSQLEKFPTISALADKVALAFNAFDCSVSPDHQAVALSALEKTSHNSAVTLTLLKTRRFTDPDLMESVRLLGTFEPMLEPLAAALILHSEASGRWQEALRGYLGDEKYGALMELGVTDRSRPLDERAILNTMAPLYGETMQRPRLLELGRYWREADTIPAFRELDLGNALSTLMNLMQRCANDAELGACVAGAFVAVHRDTLLTMGVTKLSEILGRLDPEIAEMFKRYFASFGSPHEGPREE